MASPLEVLRALTLPDGEFWATAFERDPWIEADVLAPILARNDDGTPRHRLVWIELARGHAKTSLVAGVALARALSGGHGVNCFALASDADQAALVLEALDGQCRRNPRLAARLRQSRERYTVKATGGFIRVLPADVPSAFGLAPDARSVLFICDELTRWRDRGLFDMALTTLPKVRDAQLIVITNAGVKRSWQEEARAALADSGYLFAAPGVIASWIRPEDLALTEANVPALVYRRDYGNVWVDSAGGFISREDLRRCVDRDWQSQLCGERAASYVYALDLGLTRDRTARAIVHLDPDGQRVVLDALKVWQGTRDDPVLIADIEEDMAYCHEQFYRPLMVVDPWQMQATIQRLRGQYRLEEFTFTSENVRRLSQNLYGLLHNGQLRLYPDVEMEAELLGLEVKQTGYGWRIDHQAQGFSDRAMALGMAALIAVERPPKKGDIFWA
jgi:phage terminase large subunit-like protein